MADLITEKGVIGRLAQALETTNGAWFDGCAINVESDSALETYAWLGQVPVFREFLGGRDAKYLRENSMTLRNVEYEATLRIPERQLRRDKTDILDRRIGEFGMVPISHKDSLVSTLMLNGAAAACYDGQYFFDTDHSEGDSGTLSNKISVDISALAVGTHGSTTAPSVSEMAQAILLGIQQMLSFKDDRGEPINTGLTSVKVVVPVSMLSVAKAAVGNMTIDQGDSNTLATLGFNVSVHANPRLTWTDRFAILRDDGMYSPIIIQTEVPPEISLKGYDSDWFFDNREIQLGLFTSCAAGYGLWQGACQVILT